MKNRIITTLIAAFTIALSTNGQQNVMDTILADTMLTGSSYSFCFADAVTGEIIFSHDAERNLASASVMKLYPTSVSLSLLGPDYRFATGIYLSGKFNRKRGMVNGDIVIRGNGDPALGSYYFADNYGDMIARWVKALKEAGVSHVKGRVAASESIYDFDPVPGGWPWSDLGQYYGAGVYDININNNEYKIYISGYSEGMPAIIDSTEVYGRNISLENRLISSGSSDEGYVYNAPYASVGWIEGTVPADSSFALRASIPDPPFTVVRMLDEALRNAGVIIDEAPSSLRSTEPLLDPPVYVTLSPPLSEIIYVTNHESVNMFAEAFRKHLGYVIAGEGTWSAGSKVIRDFLDYIGCEPQHAVLRDGSGLSPGNKISALMTTKLLVHMYNADCSPAFLASLPEGDVSGTMKYYFNDEFFKERVIAKTGTINSVKSFAGYVVAGSGRRVAFTMLCNGFTVPSRTMTDYMEKVVREIILNY